MTEYQKRLAGMDKISKGTIKLLKGIFYIYLFYSILSILSILVTIAGN